MRYLDYPLLNQLSKVLSSDTSTDLRVTVRFEAYSIKADGKEKRAFKEREGAYMSEQEGMEEMSFSPEMREAGLASCFGRLDEKESRKVHFLLVTTLNAAFPDHDFTSLRPDHFTREHSSMEVLSHLSGSLLGTVGAGVTQPIFLSNAGRSSPSASPASSSPTLGAGTGLTSTRTNTDLYRALNEVVPLDECEVYSWFPEPEYDPHIEPEPEDDGIEEDDLFDFSNTSSNKDDMEVDGDDDAGIPGSWAGAGMDLDMDDINQDNLVSTPMARQLSTSGIPLERMNNDWDAGRERRVGGLLWSANYFFYSKRQKRVLFLTCWCKNHHPTNYNNTNNGASIGFSKIESTFPAPISSSISSYSYSSPSSIHEHFTPLSNGTAIRNHRYHHHHNHSKKKNHRTISGSSGGGGGDRSSMIPIRGMEKHSQSHSQAQAQATPRSGRLASSAPSSFTIGSLKPLSSITGTSTGISGSGNNQTPNRIARMTAGGFKPRQTPARALMNSQTQSKVPASGGIRRSSIQDGTGTGTTATEGGVVVGNRRERSTSTTPGATTTTSALTAGLRGMPRPGKGDTGKGGGKRVKV